MEPALAALQREVNQEGDDLLGQITRNATTVAGQLDALATAADSQAEQLHQLSTELDGRIDTLQDRFDKEASAWAVRDLKFVAEIAKVDGQLQEMQAFIVKTAEEAQERRSAIQAAPAMQEMTPERGLELNEMMRLMASLPAQQEEFSRRRAAAAASGNAASGNVANGNAANFRQPAGGGL